MLSNLMLPFAFLLAVSCTTQNQVEKTVNKDNPTFTQVQTVLERNCVHCHGASRLTGMPPLTDSEALANLIGSNNLIIPGKPEQSRFLTVVTLSDNQAGAMPPTGHAISESETSTLRKWIQAGAPLPTENVQLKSKGESPRSR